MIDFDQPSVSGDGFSRGRRCWTGCDLPFPLHYDSLFKSFIPYDFFYRYKKKVGMSTVDFCEQVLKKRGGGGGAVVSFPWFLLLFSFTGSNFFTGSGQIFFPVPVKIFSRSCLLTG